VKALPLAGTAIEDVQVLAFGVVGAGGTRQFEMCADDIGNFAQDGCGALLAIVLHHRGQVLQAAGLHGPAHVGG